MTNTTTLIQLSAEELISLIKEKVVQRGDICIASNSSFLMVIKLMEYELKRLNILESNKKMIGN